MFWGDLNQLSVEEVAEHTGLTPLIEKPTRGQNILDRLFVSEPCYPIIRIVTSVLKTDHKAIIASSVENPSVGTKPPKR